jgi:hypothetical protein
VGPDAPQGDTFVLSFLSYVICRYNKNDNENLNKNDNKNVSPWDVMK